MLYLKIIIIYKEISKKDLLEVVLVSEICAADEMNCLE